MNKSAVLCAALTILHLFIHIKGEEEGRIKRLTVPSYTAPNNYSGPGNEYGSTSAYTVDESEKEEKKHDLRLTQTDFANMGYDDHLRSIGQKVKNKTYNKAEMVGHRSRQPGYDLAVDKNKSNFEDLDSIDETGYETLSQMDQLNYDNVQNMEDDIGNNFEHSEDSGQFPQDTYGDQVHYEGHFDSKGQVQGRFRGQNAYNDALRGQSGFKNYDFKSQGHEGQEEIKVHDFKNQEHESQGQIESSKGQYEGQEVQFDGGHGGGGGGGHGGGGGDDGGHVSYQAGHTIKIVKVPHIIKYTVIKKVPYKVEIPVPAPYGVPYDVPKEVFVKKPVQIEIYKPYVVHVGKPYHITEHSLVEVPVVRKVPYTVHKAIKVPYAHKIYVKKPIYITKHSSGGGGGGGGGGKKG